MWQKSHSPKNRSSGDMQTLIDQWCQCCGCGDIVAPCLCPLVFRCAMLVKQITTARSKKEQSFFSAWGQCHLSVFSISLQWLNSKAYNGVRQGDEDPPGHVVKVLWMNAVTQEPAGLQLPSSTGAEALELDLSQKPESTSLAPTWDPGSLKPTDTFLTGGWKVSRLKSLLWVLTF